MQTLHNVSQRTAGEELDYLDHDLPDLSEQDYLDHDLSDLSEQDDLDHDLSDLSVRVVCEDLLQSEKSLVKKPCPCRSNSRG